MLGVCRVGRLALQLNTVARSLPPLHPVPETLKMSTAPNLPAPRPRRRRRHPRGFSLIELGIVIAVIAVLAAVVIFGRGFILAGRVTKAVEASNTIRKSASTYAGLLGGSLRGQPPATSQLNTLQARSLVPALNNGVWFVSGSTAAAADAIRLTDVRFGQIVNPANNQISNAVAVRYDTPNGSLPADIYSAVQDDTNLVRNGATIDGSQACAGPNAVPTIPASSVWICFFL